MRKPKNDKLLKAITAGTIFGGLVDVFRLEDGSIILSQRGVVRALTAKDQGVSGTTNEATLDRYLTRLPNGYLDLTARPKTFILPQGGTAYGIRVEGFSAILEAYARAYQDGALHHSQEHIGRNANRMALAALRVTIQKMAEEAVGVIRPNTEDWFTHFFREKPLNETIWPARFTRQYCRWNGVPWKEGQSQPLSMKSANGFFYSMIFPYPVLVELRNKGLEAACKLHQILTDKPRGYLAAQLDVAVALAETSISETQWRRRMRAFYRKDKNLSWDFDSE